MKQNYIFLKRLFAMTFAGFVLAMAISGQPVLKHSYTFEDGTANDIVGTAHGVLEGDAVVTDTFLTLSGGRVVLPGPDINISSYSSITVEALFAQAPSLNGFTVLYGFGAENPEVDWMGINYFIYQPTRNDNDNSRLSISCLNTTDPWATESGVNAPRIGDTELHHVVTIITATDMYYYLDGALMGSATLSADNQISNLSNDVGYIGASLYPADPRWRGTVHEMHIYEGVMEASTISQRAGDLLYGEEANNASLKDLTTNMGAIDPVFDPETDAYEVYVPYGTTSLTIDAVPTISSAPVVMFDGLGNEVPADGVVTFGADGMDIEIIVNALSGLNSQTYYLSIFLDPASESNRLSGIDLSAGSLIEEFDPNVTEYTALVPNGTASVDVTGVPMWQNATVTGGGAVTLTEGTATATLTVTSEDGAFTKEYTVALYETVITTGQDFYFVQETSGFVLSESGEAYNVIRLAFPEKDKPEQLCQLEASGVAGQYFVKNGLGNYLSLVSNPVWDMVMTPTLTTDLDSCRFVINEFEPGRFRIQSVARMATTSSYDMGPNNPPAVGGGIFSDKWPDNNLATWNIMLPDDVVDPYDTYLDTLFIDGIGMKPVFEFYNKEYFITIPEGTTSLDISALPRDPTATVTGTGTISVGDEGAITITVTATDNAYSTEYIINYQVDPELTLMHAYTFADGTVQDQEGDLHGMANGGSVVNGAFVSANEGDYLTFSGADLAINEYPSITLEAYVTTGNNPGWTMLSYFGNTGGANSYWMSIARNDDVSMTNIDLPGFGATNASGPEPGVGEDHHYVSVLTNDTIFWYIDGTLAGKNALGPNMLINKISTYGAWLCYGGYNDPTWFGSVHEFNIYKGQMDPLTVAARAAAFPVEDETSNGSLSDLMVDGVTIEGFSPLIMDYDIVLEAGTTVIPVVTATTSNTNAVAAITDATELPGSTTVEVTAEDGLTVVTYTVNFEYEISDNATLADLTVDGTTITGFDPAVRTYEVIMPAGSSVPAVAGTQANTFATVTVTDAASIPGTTTVVVTAQDGVTKITYSVNFKYDLSSDATLSDLTVDGTTVNGFSSNVVAYSVTLPQGTTTVPTVAGTATHTGANVVVTPAASLPGTTTIVVTAEDGTTTKSYSIYFDLDVSVESMKAAAIKVYPTISDGSFRVEAPGRINTISVHDITGKMVLQQVGESYEQQFTIQHEGMYFVTVECEGVTKTVKVVKTR